MSLSVEINCGGGTLQVRDVVGPIHGSSGAAAVIAVELEVAFSSTVAAVDVLGSRILGFL